MAIIATIFGVMKFFVSVDFAQIAWALVLITNLFIGLCMLIPGEQPEKFLQGIVNWLQKHSRKPKE